MKSLGILFMTMLLAFSAQAEKSTHQGFYEVPRPDGKIIDFPSSLQFEGDSLAEAEEIEVLFPPQLVGMENHFKLKKVDDQWVGNPELFEKVDCHLAGDVYDFSCRLEFKKESVVDVTGDAQGNPAVLDNDDIKDLFSGTSVDKLFVDRVLAKEQLLGAGLQATEVSARLESTDIFINEPIGFLKYRAVSY